MEKRKAILMGVPHHNNLGDSAIAIAERKFIKDYFVDCDYYEVSEETLETCIDKVKHYVNCNDIIFLHGGGNLGNEYMWIERARRKVIELLPNNTIILFPETIYFHDTEDGQAELARTKDIYSKHPNLTLIAREKVSYSIMKKNFPNNRVILAPDIVTYLDETKDEGKREGVLFMLRNDRETNTTEEQTKYFEQIASKYFNKIEYDDTAKGDDIFEHDRLNKLNNIFEKYRNAELIVTDRLHGMIFAAITSTPCIALANYNHKMKECFNMIKHLGYIKFNEDPKKFEAQLKSLINKKHDKYSNEFAINGFEQILDSLDVLAVS